MKYLFSPFPNLSTDRLVLRQMDHDDLKEVFALRSNKLVSEYLSRPIVIELNEALEYIEMINKGISRNEWVLWAITLKGTNRLIGTICLWNFSNELEKGEVGYELSPTLQGQGIMQEALTAVLNFGFKDLNLRTIEGNVNPKNSKSIQLLEKNHFLNLGLLNEESQKVNQSASIIFSLSNSSYK